MPELKEPPGVVTGFDVDFLTNVGLTPEQAKLLVGDDKPTPVAAPEVPKEPVTTCDRCGWTHNGVSPSLIPPDQYGRVIEELLFVGRYTHAVKLFDGRVTVVFRTLYATEEDACTNAVRALGFKLATVTVPDVTEAVFSAGELVFAASVGEVLFADKSAYTAPTTLTDPTGTLTAINGVLKSSEIRIAVNRAFQQFRSSVEHALVATQKPNF